ncbi:putative LRR receptor-like serine/threonine-protein kinase [Raphanus sativus]|uniref:non-specific serine/threonine protein kinase n=1 Tax=Raphanus sativus TaxID=3726 RepID=A0A6J0MZR7_RAPSA|nr:probable LRR receptor-like serine/threonine-protein kinase At5g59680 [Raphanus sativus]KAJ4875129.1 putative LRR receptor-like serine/threonine-protein kinase [Raphanus sativus]
MESSLGLLLVLISSVAIHIGQAQDQKEFISLDCGLPANELSPYKEAHTKLLFSSDENFIQSGKNGRVQANREREFLKPYRTLRYFPNGTRNCYSLTVEKGRNHLIRAFFTYANYDGFDNNPNFDLYLGPNLWETIDFQGQVKSVRAEMLHIPTSNSLQICLVKTGTTIPFISTLEIRPMGNDSYVTDSGSLNLFFRRYFTESKNYIRYANDIYDRAWLPYFQTEWTQISTTLQVNNSNSYIPPKDALSTAAIPTNSSAPLTIQWNSSYVNNQYYFYIHFAEIQELKKKDSREFNITWNGKVILSSFIPPKFRAHTVFAESPGTCDGGDCSLQLIRTNRSTLPPLLSALEVYTVIQFPQSETNEIDVIAVQNIKITYGISRISWQGDPCVPQWLMWDGLSCSTTDMSTPPRITHLNLSSSGLTGTITDGIKNLTSLETLDLSNNNLIGEVPDFLGNMKSLVFINISMNDLSGLIPQTLQRKGLKLFSQGNPGLCLSGSCLPPKPKSFPVAIIVSVLSVAISIIGILVLTLVLRKKNPSTVAAQRRPPSISSVNVTYANSPASSIQTNKRSFTYSEVISMTNNFQRVVGEGGFGIVYHGALNVYGQVAVKLLSQSSTQGYKEFKAEVDLLMRVHHTNLVSLIGYCNEGDHLALIYEFVPNGDLRQHLSGKGGRSIINWGTRLRIVVEAASGLEYLHTGCIPPMVHRDVKTTNILLDERFKARLADFGLSRSFPVGNESHVSTIIAGTSGYLDPEYYRTNRLTEKSDVYSFGIVLLEMITNQPVIDQSREKSHITEWVGFEVNSGDIRSIMDPNLQEDYDSDSAWRIFDLAMSCANASSKRRPSMSQVVVELKECLASEILRRNMMNRGRMEARSSAEVTVLVDTEMFPVAR